MKSEFIIASLCYAIKSSEELNQYKDRWLFDNTLIEILHAHYWSHEEFKYTRDDLITALKSKKLLSKYHLGDIEDFRGNTSGLLQVNAQLKGDTSKSFAFFISSHASESTLSDAKTQATKKRYDVVEISDRRRSSRRRKLNSGAAADDSSEGPTLVIMQPKTSSSKFWADLKTAHTAICKDLQSVNAVQFPDNAIAIKNIEHGVTSIMGDLDTSSSSCASSTPERQTQALHAVSPGRMDGISIWWNSTSADKLFHGGEDDMSVCIDVATIFVDVFTNKRKRQVLRTN